VLNRFTGGGLLSDAEQIGAQWLPLMADLALKQGVFHRFCLIVLSRDLYDR